jgi:pilus assembly protein Flp/PilA
MSWSFQMKKFFKDESGATAIEYGLIAAATGLALIGVMPTLSANLGSTTFSTIATNISGS